MTPRAFLAKLFWHYYPPTHTLHAASPSWRGKSHATLPLDEVSLDIEDEESLSSYASSDATETPEESESSYETGSETGSSSYESYTGSSSASDSAAVLDEGVGAEAQLRFQKATLQVMETELAKAREQAASKASRLQAAELQLKEAHQHRAKLERSEKGVQASLERERAAASEQRLRADTLERELSLLRKESEEQGKGQRNALGELRGKDVRLNRALEELERYRSQLREMREARDGQGHDARSDAQRLAAENARLRKRQADLILAFKKQAKLIDVLKRQKLHVEAARMLAFTEEEFSRTLELGEQMAA